MHVLCEEKMLSCPRVLYTVVVSQAAVAFRQLAAVIGESHQLGRATFS